jgi:hypothetical protein
MSLKVDSQCSFLSKTNIIQKLRLGHKLSGVFRLNIKENNQKKKGDGYFKRCWVLLIFFFGRKNSRLIFL